MRGGLGSRASGSALICSAGFSEVSSMITSGKLYTAAATASSRWISARLRRLFIGLLPWMRLAPLRFDPRLCGLQRCARRRAGVDRVLRGPNHFVLKIRRARDLRGGNLVRAAGQFDEHAKVGIAIEVVLKSG